MKIKIGQINPHIGAIEQNVSKMQEIINSAIAAGDDLVVFSELCVCGYPPKDMLSHPDFVDAIIAANDKIAKMSTEQTGIIFGSIIRNSNKYSDSGKPLMNVAILAHGGQVSSTIPKSLLPTYDVFDEARYFEPCHEDDRRCIEFKGKRIALTVCEDCWNDKSFWSRRYYEIDPISELADEDPDLFINISASPFAVGKPLVRRNMIRHLAKKYQKPFVYVNQVGGFDDVVYDGRSMVFNGNGELCVQAADFKEDSVVVDSSSLVSIEDSVPIIPDDDDIYSALVLGTRDYARKCGFKTACIGLSGGIDSALVAAIAAVALGPSNVYGYGLPSRYSSDGSKDDARSLANALGINFDIIAIEPMFSAFLGQLAPSFAGRPEDVTEENIQARIRGSLLMAMSNKFGHLLLTTGNKSEVAVGYCTLYGDTCGGLAVISDVYKTTVYRLARLVNDRAGRQVIPESTIIKPPSAELRPGQTDQQSLPPYPLLDAILKGYIEDEKSIAEIAASEDVKQDVSFVKKWISKVDSNEYKRAQLAPGIKVTKKAFGTGRVMPIAQGWKS